MSLIDSIKQDAKKSGQNKGKFMYFREGQKYRIRFLQDVDDGMEIVFHDSYDKGINVPCQDIFGRNCPYCDDEEVRTRSQYLWSVWDYESKEVKLFMFPVNNCSPIPSLMAMYENYGTLQDRDYIVTVNGKGTNKTFSVVPMDKVKFRNAKAKPYSKKSILKMLDKAWPCDEIDSDDIDDSDDDQENEYENMTPQELYKECKKRGIESKPKKSSKYYINLLVEDDKAKDDWDDDDEEESTSWDDIDNEFDDDEEEEKSSKKKSKRKSKKNDDWDDDEEEDEDEWED